MLCTSKVFVDVLVSINQRAEIPLLVLFNSLKLWPLYKIMFQINCHYYNFSEYLFIKIVLSNDFYLVELEQ